MGSENKKTSGNKDLCACVFQNGHPSREKYTAIWVMLINRLIQDQRAPAPEEEKI